jgi:hypothetical protein
LRMKGIEFHHCDSCHEDFDEWGYEMCEIDLGKNRYAEVCCSISTTYNHLDDAD